MVIENLLGASAALKTEPAATEPRGNEFDQTLHEKLREKDPPPKTDKPSSTKSTERSEAKPDEPTAPGTKPDTSESKSKDKPSDEADSSVAAATVAVAISSIVPMECLHPIAMPPQALTDKGSGQEDPAVEAVNATASTNTNLDGLSVDGTPSNILADAIKKVAGNVGQTAVSVAKDEMSQTKTVPSADQPIAPMAKVAVVRVSTGAEIADQPTITVLNPTSLQVKPTRDEPKSASTPELTKPTSDAPRTGDLKAVDKSLDVTQLPKDQTSNPTGSSLAAGTSPAKGMSSAAVKAEPKPVADLTQPAIQVASDPATQQDPGTKNDSKSSSKDQDDTIEKVIDTRQVKESPTNVVATNLKTSSPVEAKASTSKPITGPTQQVADKLDQLLAARKNGTVVIHLEPRELGSIILTVRQTGNRMDAEITTNNDQVRQDLLAQQNLLQARVENKGLQLGSLNVNTQDAGSHQQNQPDRQALTQQDFIRQARLREASTESSVAAPTTRSASRTSGVDLSL